MIVFSRTGISVIGVFIADPHAFVVGSSTPGYKFSRDLIFREFLSNLGNS
jgi:hypothetical protein